MSRLQCLACGFSSTSYEAFNAISLEIPKCPPRHARFPVTIHDCLRNYTSEERLTAEDAWTCPDCKCPREASKRLTITRAPDVLVLQLKRFRSERRGFTDKTNTFVDFPLTRLDLTPYALPPIPASEEAPLRERFGNEVMQPTPATTPPFEYDAYGVVQHFGTLTGGHYKALIRAGSGRWMEFNDRIVTEFREAGPGGAGKGERKVQTESAYLLFYVRSNVE
jgi:ubiquitin carboxyl-terminal hydrolase 8